jgi:hypothetical protein
MKKHIIGFAIFSIIVGSAVFVKAIFNISREIIVPTADNYSYTTVKKTSCWKMRQELEERSTPVVKQVVLDLNNKRIDWAIFVPQKGYRVALHFYAKSPKSNRYISTELAPGVAHSPTWVTYSSTYISFLNFSPYENLYVVPEMITPSDAENKFFNPEFNENTAVPVTVYGGKTVTVK